MRPSRSRLIASTSSLDDEEQRHIVPLQNTAAELGRNGLSFLGHTRDLPALSLGATALVQRIGAALDDQKQLRLKGP